MTLQDLLIDELQDLYDAEQQLIKALPEMVDAANGDALRAAFASHLGETQGQITRLEEVFVQLGMQPTARRCAGMAGILSENTARMAQRAAAQDMIRAVSDAALIAGAQKVEHYEICGYGTCAAWARTLGLDEVAARLEETLEEEKAADQALNDLAEQEVNISAAHEAT
jgi:ferritin-like metal-binding protein YciE